MNGNAPLVWAIPPLELFPVHEILPLTIPVPLDTLLLSKANPVIEVPWVVVIDTSLLAIVPLKFCCWKLNIILDGVAEESDESSNDITCESKLPINNFAEVPSEPSLPCCDTASDIVFEMETEALAAVKTSEPLNGALVLVTVTGFVPLVVM